VKKRRVLLGAASLVGGVAVGISAAGARGISVLDASEVAALVEARIVDSTGVAALPADAVNTPTKLQISRRGEFWVLAVNTASVPGARSRGLSVAVFIHSFSGARARGINGANDGCARSRHSWGDDCRLVGSRRKSIVQ
jgi:hypothetical protein